MNRHSLNMNDHVRGSVFFTDDGTREYFFTICAEQGETFEDELASLYRHYSAAMESYGLSENTLVFGRFYLSDIANEKDILRKAPIFGLIKKSAVSTIQQCPLEGGSVCLLVYHIRRNGDSFEKTVMSFDGDNRRNGALIHGTHYDLLWVANFFGVGEFDSYSQTGEIFSLFEHVLSDNGMNLLDNAVRTWVYVRDVDNHYRGMVESRKEFFARHGLTTETRYIASTGIEGFSKEVDSIVSFDAFAIKNLLPEQIVRMEALENLSTTIKYGVTFERGTRIRFGDRSHLHLSGTASIDKNGDVLHLFDPREQTRRTIENIRALLKPHGAGLEDMAYMIVYIRNHKDKDKVMDILRAELPESLPFHFLEGAVCRPSWLVELEGVAIIDDDTEFPPFF